MRILHPDVAYAKICPYCRKEPVYVDSAEIYGKSYGMVYLCRPCNAWVGVHKGTDKPLGRLANAELREAKKLAHQYFDALWKKAMSTQGRTKHDARTSAYAWMSKIMNVKPEFAHIGMFDVQQCIKLAEISKAYLYKDKDETWIKNRIARM